MVNVLVTRETPRKKALMALALPAIERQNYGGPGEKAWSPKTRALRALSKSLLPLLVAAVAMAAAVAHGTIDVFADYLVDHASFDDVGSHESRSILVAVALVAAGIVALRGLKICCEAAARRTTATPNPPGWRIGLAFAGATALLTCLAVPAMEWLDTSLAGGTLDGLTDAYGGSLLLGLASSAACAAIVAFVIFGIVRWLLSHHARIVAAIVDVIRRWYEAVPAVQQLRRFTSVRFTLQRDHARPCGKRAPPRGAFFTPSLLKNASRGYQCFTFSLRRAASSAVTSTPTTARRSLMPASS
jgi:hypothetical protein